MEVCHCRDCNKDFVKCGTCRQSFPTNLTTDENARTHICRTREDSAQAAKTAAAGGVAAGTAAGLGVTAGAPAALGAVGFTGSGVAGGSIAASLQGLLYAGATPAGGWFATCTSAAMGGAMGAAAVTAVAATGGVAVAAGAGYGIYKYVKGKTKNASCPWCTMKQTKCDKMDPPPDKPNEKNTKISGGKSACFGDNLIKSDDEIMELAIKRSLQTFDEEKLTREGGVNNGKHRHTYEDSGMETMMKELECPVCREYMIPPLEIWQCANSHLVCDRCKNNPDLRSCPSCKGEIVSRNRPMENIAKIYSSNNS